MSILHWLLQQVVLTGQQIRTDVTIPHIIDGIILYTIVHKLAKKSEASAAHTQKLFKSEARRIIHRHVHERHGGHPLVCQHPDCEEQLNVITEPMPQ